MNVKASIFMHRAERKRFQGTISFLDCKIHYIFFILGKSKGDIRYRLALVKNGESLPSDDVIDKIIIQSLCEIRGMMSNRETSVTTSLRMSAIHFLFFSSYFGCRMETASN